MIKLCIFDMDGLLIDSERQMWVPHEKQALSEMGYPVREGFLNSLMGLSNENSRSVLKDEYGDGFDVDEFYRRVIGYNNEMVETKGIPLKQGAVELLEYLKNKGIRIALGTSSTRDYVEAVLSKAGVFDYFEKVVCGDEIVNGKPAPDIYIKAKSGFGVQDDETLIFEDAHNGALAALGSGCQLVLVPDIAYLPEEDLNNAYAVIDKLDDIIEILEK